MLREGKEIFPRGSKSRWDIFFLIHILFRRLIKASFVSRRTREGDTFPNLQGARKPIKKHNLDWLFSLIIWCSQFCCNLWMIDDNVNSNFLRMFLLLFCKRFFFIFFFLLFIWESAKIIKEKKQWWQKMYFFTLWSKICQTNIILILSKLVKTIQNLNITMWFWPRISYKWEIIHEDKLSAKESKGNYNFVVYSQNSNYFFYTWKCISMCLNIMRWRKRWKDQY